MYLSRTREGGCVALLDDRNPAFARLLSKPSDGLEPETPSLPWRFSGGTGVHNWAFTITFFLQIGTSRCALSARSCPRVPKLMYPSRTRGLLSSYKTSNNLMRPN